MSGRNAVVERNQLRSMLKEAGAVRPIALLLAGLSANGSLRTAGGRVSGNLISGVQEDVVVIGNEGAELLDNRVETEGQEVGFGMLLVASSRICVQGNRLTNTAWPIATSGDMISGSAHGDSGHYSDADDRGRERTAAISRAGHCE